MKNNDPKVYVLILNYCSFEDTIECVKQLRKNTYNNFRALVLDNNSPDLSGVKLKEQLPSSEFLQLNKNIGYAGGNNIGIKIALKNNADYILIVNPDIRLPPDSISHYVNIMQSDTNIAGLNSIQLQEDCEHFDTNFLLGVLQPMGFPEKTLSASKLPDIFDSNLIFGAALMLSAAALKQVGGFDPLYFAYGEEIDLCRRFRMHGYRLVVTSQEPVVHLRTVYTKPLSQHVLFLRLKGYYLSRLKKPDNSIKKVIRSIFHDIKAALAGRAQNIYPYNTYNYNRAIIIKTACWLIFFMPLIWLHKKQEKNPYPRYIQ